MSADHAGRGPDYAARRSALRGLLMENEVDALMVTDPVNIRYLTGFCGKDSALLVHSWDTGNDEERTVIGTDGCHRDLVAVQAPDLRAEIASAATRRIVELAGEWHVGRVGYESHVVTVEQHRGMVERRTGLEFAATVGLVEQLRMVKDAHEAARIRTAAGACDSGLRALLEAGGLRPGRTERQVARDLAWVMFEHGAEWVAAATVATGKNSAVPRHRPADTPLDTGDLVAVRCGAVVGDYHAVLTRTFVLGRAEEWQREAHALVAAAREAGRAALRPGVAVSAVDAAARAVIEAAGHGKSFVHGLGHGVGLRIDEAPGIAKTGTGTLLSGVAVTVEPGVYFPGRGGVRIEDTLVVREGGSELLTHTSTDLTVVD
ncbi:M24 family metallopeptidase [Nocardia beijingensis]|uniref:M24 family metallopeptidase n=1 Tax=Nocardia beijingensis TaxID=95162 RepID=UPI0033BDA200